MTLHYAFNGDADGLCALQQLRLVDPREATLVTGVKRDIELLRRVNARQGDEVTVLDISLDRNRADLVRLLDAGATVRYFDHHHAGDVPRHPRFEPHLDESPTVCTSVLVDRYLGGRHRAWAIAAAFGDNMPELAFTMARAAELDAAATATLEQLGVRLNYNAYGSTIDDLCFDPADLAQQMRSFADPLEFARGSPAYCRLGECYDSDMREARALQPALDVPGARMYVLPDVPWARRAIGVLANDLTQANPDSAIAILVPGTDSALTVSVRVPPQCPVSAEAFCRGFATGGGRKQAAGINRLPVTDLTLFAARFESSFGSAAAPAPREPAGIAR